MSETTISQQKDFSDTPEGWEEYWRVEFEASRKEIEPWQKSAQVSLDAYKDEKAREDNERKVNLFWANVTTQKALLYGRIPTVDVSRRFQDAEDDLARVGALVLQRALNTDIERDADGFRHSLRHALTDYLIIGYGHAHIRYQCQFEKPKPESEDEGEPGEQPEGTASDAGEDASEGEQEPVKARDEKGNVLEDVVTEYSHWKDQLWGPCKVFEELPWWAFSTAMTRDEVAKRFGEEVAKAIPYTSTHAPDKKDDSPDPWDRAIIWEIWSKRHKQVFWRAENHDKVIDRRPDPLGLKGFWPFPRPLMANLTTDKFLPRSDYAMVQDLYDNVNTLSFRIKLIEEAIRAAGVYDKNAGEEVEGLLTQTTGNKLIPVDNFAMTAERGGLKGVIDWLPLEQLVMALEKLQAQLQEAQRLLYEVTGWSDLMRGQAMDGGETATAAAGKMRYASVRVQHAQNEFARFATELQQLRAEAIVNLFDAETIKRRSNIERTPDKAVADQAIAMLKDDFPNYRVEVRSEALAQQDFALLKAERTEFLVALSSLVQSLGPALTQIGPPGQMLLLELLKWTAAGFRGGQTIEGVLDQALSMAQQQARAQAAGGAPGPQPDPKLAQQQQKHQLEMQKMQAEHALDMEKLDREAQTEERVQSSQARWNILEESQRQEVRNRGEQQRALLRPAPQPRRAGGKPAGPKGPGAV